MTAPAPSEAALARLPQPLLKLWPGYTDAQRRAARRALYRRVFDTPDGRAALADILATSGYFAVSPPSDPATIAYREGCRWTAGQILDAIGVTDAALGEALPHDNLSKVFDVDL